MSAVVVATAFGGPEVLSVIDQPTPVAGPDEVLIAVRAIGVNPVDWKAYSGAMGADPARLPLRLGTEAAGVVTAAGPGVTSVAVGDEVIAFRAPGAYAAELVAPVEALTPKPLGLAWAQAGGLMLTGATAVHALAVVNVAEGDTVLVHGGAGGVGLVAVQLAVARRATVIATASPARHDLLRELGAVPITYRPGLVARVRAVAAGPVDAAVDLVGTDEALDSSLELVADHGRIVTAVVTPRARQAGIKLIGGAPGADPGTRIRMSARAQLAALADAGALRVIVANTYPLTDVAAAHRQSIAGHAAGKIILLP